MKDLLNQAKDEIQTLRRANEILQAKVDTMELFACVLHTAPARISQGVGEDVAWKLERKIQELEDAEMKDAHQGRTGGRVDESWPAGNGG